MVTGLEQLSCEEGWREPGSFSLEKRRLDAPSLQAFQARLDVALGSLGWCLATLHTAGGWKGMTTVVLFNPGHSMIQ